MCVRACVRVCVNYIIMFQELWRNEEILSLASVNQMESKITELEKLVVMKRDKKRQLEAIS